MRRWILLPLLLVATGCAAPGPAPAALAAPVIIPPAPVGQASVHDSTAHDTADGRAAVPLPQATTAPPLTTGQAEAPDRPPAPDAAGVVAAVRGVVGSAQVGLLVLDRRTGAEVVSTGADRRFRSASLVKLVIAVDVLRAGAGAATRERVARMLRLSDDDIASALWVERGGSELVRRTAELMGLGSTLPPAIPGRWGDVLLTARDVARTYDYVLGSLPVADRDLVVDALATAPRAAADGFDQHFGIPDGLSAPWAVKQGWSDSVSDIVLHSTGLVGAEWRHVVVLLTEYPRRTSWAAAAEAVTAGARTLDATLR